MQRTGCQPSYKQTYTLKKQELPKNILRSVPVTVCNHTIMFLLVVALCWIWFILRLEKKSVSSSIFQKLTDYCVSITVLILKRVSTHTHYIDATYIKITIPTSLFLIVSSTSSPPVQK